MMMLVSVMSAMNKIVSTKEGAMQLNGRIATTGVLPQGVSALISMAFFATALLTLVAPNGCSEQAEMIILRSCV